MDTAEGRPNPSGGYRFRSLPRVAAIVVVALALTAAGCDSTDDASTTFQATATTPATTGTEQAEGFTYRVGMIDDILRPNFWAFYGPNATVNMSYIFGPTKPSLFSIAYPGIVVAPDVAVGLPAKPVQEGDVWTVTQPIRDDYTWSDGSLLTAHDIVFTYETVRDAELTNAWIESYPYTEDSSPRLLAVEAVDDFTARYTFDSKPGAAQWPHQVGIAPIMPRTPWEPVVAEALRSEDPAGYLYDTDAMEVGDLSGGPVAYHGREEGVSVENVRNEHYANAGFTHQFWADGSYALNGELLYGVGVGDPITEYTEGPYLDRTVFTIYADQSAAMLALLDGQIDYWIDATGMSPGIRRQGLEADDLAVTVNSNSAFAYLGFNLRKSPGKFQGFRQALAYFDKENLTNNVLQGAYLPLYVLVPEGNIAWYDEAAAREIASTYVGLSTDGRLAAAYTALEDDGFTWATPPERDADGFIVTPGAGIVDPEGNVVPALEILTLSSTPQFHTAALWFEDWAEQLGIPARADPTDFNTLRAGVWPGVDREPTFDMYILSWRLPNPAWPTFHESFFHTRHLAETTDGNNSTGYKNPAFDALADAMLTETDQATAFDQVWEMERMLAEELPYVVLFTAPVTEFYNEDLQYPFTQTLAGIQFLDGMQGTVDLDRADSP
jgi:peptide/nickel transport system substrate-binding protein